MIIYKRKRKKLVIPVGLGPNVSEITGYELQNKTVDSSTVEQTVYSDVDYYGLYSVKVRPYILDAKTVDSSTVQQVVTSDASALYQVIVNPYTLENRTQTITQNGEYSFTPEYADGLARVDISVNVADIPAVVQTKSVVYTENGEYSVEPDEGYDGLSHVDVSVNVESVSPELQGKTVDPSISQITVEPDQGYDGLSSVTVNPIDSSLDPDLSPENIKKDVEIFGVIGTYEGQQINNQSKTVDSSTTIQYVQPDQGYTGLDYVAVNPYTVESDSSTLTQNGTYVFTPDNADALSQVTVDVSVASSTPELQSKTVDSSTTQQTVTPDQNYDGLSQVVVEPYVLDSSTVNASTYQQVITSNADGLSSVTVNPYTLDGAVVDFWNTKNNPFAGYAMYTKQQLGVTADGIKQVTMYKPFIGNYTFEPSTARQFVDPGQVTSSGYTLNYFGWIACAPVTASIDPDIQPENIKKDVEILGVVGTFEGGPLGTKTVDSSTVSQTVTPDSSDYGLSSVTVNPYTTETDSSVLTANGQYVFTPQNADALSQVTVDVSVSGGGSINNQNKTVDSSTVSQSITADQGYTGLGTVTVNPYTTETDSSVLTQNGTYTFTPQNADALSSVTVDVNVSGIQDGSITLNVVRSSPSSLSAALGSVENPPKNAIVNIWRGGTGMGEDDRAMNSELALLNSVSLENVTITTPYKYTVTYVVLMLGSYHLGQTPYHNPFIKECPNVKNITIDLSDRITSMRVERAIFFDPDDTSTYSQLSDLTLTVPWFALDSSNNGKICENLGDKLTNLILTRGPITSSITTDNYGMSLTSNSVYNILSQLDANTSGESVTFYSGGLTVTDYSDGRIQTAYDAAVAAGWTINNLTINQPAPSITLLEYITAGDSHTENNKIELPCNVTNETVIQFTVNWRDDQGGAFIATAGRDFNQNEWRTFGYNNCLYSDLGGGIGGNRFYVAETWSAVYHQYGTVEIGVDSSYHIYQKDVSTGITYTSTNTTQFRSIGTDHISYIGSDYTWLREIKVYENGISGGLTYDFVAAKDQNDVPGLYDTVGSQMYYATSGTMIAGPVLS